MLRLLNPTLSVLVLAAFLLATATVVEANDSSETTPNTEQAQPAQSDIQPPVDPTSASDQTSSTPTVTAEPSIKLQEDETTWVEEKITPSTRWIENLVSPWTQWMEKKIQRQTLHTVNRPPPTESASTQDESIEGETKLEDNEATDAATDSAAADSQPAIISLNEALARVESLYDGNILGANFIDQVPPLYRIKVLLPNGEIRIVQMNAETGKLW